MCPQKSPKSQTKKTSKQRSQGELRQNDHSATRLILIALASLLPIVFNPFGYNIFPEIRLLLVILSSLLIFLIFCIEVLNTGRLKIKIPPFNLPLTILATITILSTLTSVHKNTSIYGSFMRYEGIVTWLSYFIIFVAASYMFREEKYLNQLVSAMGFSAILISAYAISQYFGYDFIAWTYSKWESAARVGSTLGQGNFLGAYLVLVLPLMLSVALCPITSAKLRWLCLTSSLLMISSLLFTLTRAAWVAFFASTIFLILINLKRIGKSHISRRILLIGLLIASFLVISMRSSIYFQRAASSFNLSAAGSAAKRLAVWRDTLPMIVDKPFLGWGPDTYVLIFPRYITADFERRITRDVIYNDPHNRTLYVASTIGILGLFAYLWLLSAFFWLAGKALKRTKNAYQQNLLQGLVAGCLAYLVQLQFNLSIIDVTPLMWLLMGAAVGLATAVLKSEEKIVQMPIRIKAAFAQKLSYLGGFILLLLVVYKFTQPVLADTYLRRGIEALARGDARQATKYHLRAVQYRADEPTYQRRLGNLYLDLAIAGGKKRYYAKAITALEDAVAANPLDEQSLFSLGTAYLLSGANLKNQSQLKQAERIFRKTLQTDPNFSECRLKLGIAYAEMGQLERAIREWQRVVSLNPTSVEAFLNLGRAFVMQGKINEAFKAYKNVLRIDPSNSQAQETLNFLRSESVN